MPTVKARRDRNLTGPGQLRRAVPESAELEINDDVADDQPIDDGPCEPSAPVATTFGERLIDSRYAVGAQPLDLTPPEGTDVVEIVFGYPEPAATPEPVEYDAQVNVGGQPIFGYHTHGAVGITSPLRFHVSLIRGASNPQLKWNTPVSGGSAIVNFYKYIGG